jgi:four helix bundle protein
MKDFRQLIVWQKAHTCTLLVYNLTKYFPREEQYGLTSQIRRATVSVPTNIAEGCGKVTQRDFAQFLQVSIRSAQEVEYLTLLSYELGYFQEEQYTKSNSLINEVKAMLISLLKKVRS